MSKAAESGEYPELLQDLREKLSAWFVARGIDTPGATQLAHATAEYIRTEWGGQNLYLSKGMNYELNIIYQQIWDEFARGASHKQLARKYKKSEQRIYQIVADMREVETQKRQGGLF